MPPSLSGISHSQRLLHSQTPFQTACRHEDCASHLATQDQPYTIGEHLLSLILCFQQSLEITTFAVLHISPVDLPGGIDRMAHVLHDMSFPGLWSWQAQQLMRD
jgi:hypothetical protein